VAGERLRGAKAVLPESENELMNAVERRKRAVELYAQGFSAKKVGDQLGRSESVVLGYLRAEGVRPRRSSLPRARTRSVSRRIR
jgi:transposase